MSRFTHCSFILFQHSKQLTHISLESCNVSTSVLKWVSNSYWDKFPLGNLKKCFVGWGKPRSIPGEGVSMGRSHKILGWGWHQLTSYPGEWVWQDHIKYLLGLGAGGKGAVRESRGMSAPHGVLSLGFGSAVALIFTPVTSFYYSCCFWMNYIYDAQVHP